MTLLRTYARHLNEAISRRFGLRVVSQPSHDRHVHLQAREIVDARLGEAAEELQGAEARIADSISGLSRKLSRLESGIESRLDAVEHRLSEVAAGGELGRQAIAARIEAIVAETARLRSVHHAHPDPFRVQRDVLELVRMLRPESAVGFTKVRVGSPNDGGYVMLDDLGGVADVYSLGIGLDSTFDLALAERGARIHQYDHSELAKPLAHPNAAFRALRIAPAPTAGSITLVELAEAASTAGVGKQILKIDIEGDEWPVLQATPPDALAAFAQIICEFHDLDRLLDDPWRERAIAVMAALTERFAVVHLHGNNYRPLVTPGNIALPQVLEVTFANRTDYRVAPATEQFPTVHDAPNDPSQPDLRLGGLTGG